MTSWALIVAHSSFLAARERVPTSDAVMVATLMELAAAVEPVVHRSAVSWRLIGRRSVPAPRAGCVRV